MVIESCWDDCVMDIWDQRGGTILGLMEIMVLDYLDVGGPSQIGPMSISLGWLMEGADLSLARAIVGRLEGKGLVERTEVEMASGVIIAPEVAVAYQITEEGRAFLRGSAVAEIRVGLSMLAIWLNEGKFRG